MSTKRKSGAPRKPVSDPSALGRENPSARRAVDAATSLAHLLAEHEYRIRALERLLEAAGVAAEKAGEE